MLEAAHRQGLAIQRDDLRALPSAQREQLRASGIENLPRDCILDIHLSTRTSNGLEPSLPSALTSRHLGVVVVLQADPEEILRRRAHRQGRHDPIDSTRDIVDQQAFNMQIARDLDAVRVVTIDAGQDVARVAAELRRALA